MPSFGVQEAARLVPVPGIDANKYSRGTLAVVAGSGNYPGAAVLAAGAAARCGAGYTTLVTPQSAASSARCHLISIPVRQVCESDGTFCMDSVAEVISLASASKAMVLGPGMGRSQAVEDFVWTVLEDEATQDIPLVIDADALFVIAGDKERFDRCRLAEGKHVLTPHEGEAARLLGEKVNDRFQSAVTLARDWHSVVVLKGPKTLVASPGGKVTVVENAGPELAKAGSGDVLAGMIGALLAQGLNEEDAACLGVYLHGRAGVMAAQKAGLISLMPEDLLECIGHAISSLEGWSSKLAFAQVDLGRREQL